MVYALFLVLALVSNSSYAACLQNEAQIFGDIVQIEGDYPAPDTPICETTLKLTQVQQHANCPVNSAVENTKIVIYKLKSNTSCHKVGDTLSGVLVERLSDGYLYLE